VDEEKPAKEAELGDRVIRGAGRVKTFHARDTDANVGLLDQGDDVGSIANG
jgi:hypothetical protein